MKTHILHLELHDDITSARDKMGWAKSGRILLVWPKRGRVLNRRLDLELLQRHSAALGAQLAVVSRDPSVRYHAPRLGIPLFRSLRQAQSKPWRTPRRFRAAAQAGAQEVRAQEVGAPEERAQETHAGGEADAQPHRRPLAERPATAPPEPHPLTRLIAFTLGVLAFLSIAAVLLPRAEVSLIPETRSQESAINVLASPEVYAVSISGEAPARWTSVIVEGRDSLASSSSLSVPDRPAIGHVVFTNLGDQPVYVPEGSVVRSLGAGNEAGAVRFSVTQGGEVPAGPGETLSLPVRCLIPGAQGNLPADRLVAIEGLLGTQLSVTNPEPIRHGSDRQEPAPSQEDRQQLFDQLSAALRRSALLELQDGLAPNDLLLPESLELLEVLEGEYQPADTQPADHLELNLRLEFQALVISGGDLAELGQMVLDANLPAGFVPLEEVQIENLTAPLLDVNDAAHWKLQARRQIRAQFHEPQVVRLSLGLAPEQAQARLQSALPLESPPHIHLFPDWWPRLPILPFRFTVQQSGD